MRGWIQSSGTVAPGRMHEEDGGTGDIWVGRFFISLPDFSRWGTSIIIS